MTDRDQAMLLHYQRQLDKVSRFDAEFGSCYTKRQKTSNGEWVPVIWHELCVKATTIYREMILELREGRYIYAGQQRKRGGSNGRTSVG